MKTIEIPLRYKLEVEGEVIKQDIEYTSAWTYGLGDGGAVVREQTRRATRIAGCLNNTILYNKNILNLSQVQNL